MSAYVVDDATIAKIVTVIKLESRLRHATRDLSAFDANELGTAMLILNHQAVNQRYNGQEWAPDYHHTSVPTTRLQAYKALQCLLYQCHEGNIPETVLYKRLRLLSGDIAHDILADSPEYEKAKWG